MELRIFTIAAICTLLTAHSCRATNLPPVFTKAMNNLALSEGTPVGTVVYTLQGVDPEGMTITYGLAGTNKFSVNTITGQVTLVQELDRETEDTLKFLVSIEDEVPGSTNNHVQVPVTVIVLDENDNAPIFKNSPYEVDVPEDERVGTTILNSIQVEDKDSVGDSLEVGCLANSQWPEACEMFELVSLQSSANMYSGALVLKKPLEYNQKQFYQFQLIATDGSLNSTAHVEVKVVDVQNTPPEFSGSLNAAVSEDAPVGTLVLTVKARDGDRAQPRDVIVELVNNPLDFFLLDSSTGELKTAKPLDREALADPSSPLNLTVRATEMVNGIPFVSQQTSSTTTVTVTIKDVNDEPPRFNKKEYFVQIPESLPLQTPLPNLEMLITDTDVGLNSVFSIRLSNEFGAFIVEPSTASGSATVTLRLNSTLDYEDPNQRKFILEVIAEELHTNPRLSNKASVTVSVTDANDNAPMFADDVHSASLSETAAPGTKVAVVRAVDRDSGRFGTEGIVYQLFGNGADLFTVDNRSGVISVAECPTPGQAPCLDFETRTDYFLQYKATDDDGAGQTTVASLHITLTDSNDNPPVFTTQVYKASIDEDAVKFEPELQVQAKDPDVSSELRYLLQEDDTPFWIDTLTGKIGVKLQSSVQMEGDDNHIVLHVIATDGVFNATCSVEITIRDVNNHAPIFELMRYDANVMEDAVNGTTVIQLQASDMDSGINSEIKYSIQKGSIDAFTIDNTTGVVRVSSKLDYDKRNIYKIQVIAADLGMPSLTGTTELTVNIINVNDKRPFFTPTVQRAEISADAERNTPVHNLVAVDPDISDKELLHYQLSLKKAIGAVDKNGKEVSEWGIFKPWFSVLQNGTVIVSSTLDRSKAAVVTLPVTVTDTSATQEQTGDGELIITIVDVNRHSPEFTSQMFTEHMVEEQPIGTVLNTYVATDKETPISSIVIHPPNDYFTIDNITGTVKTAKRIDYEKIQQIDFTIIAYDSGVPQRSSSANVTVYIENVNDEEPKFVVDKYEASVPENSPVGTSVLTLQATDGDLGPYGSVVYSLVGGAAPLLTVDASSGVVTLAASPDRERTVELRLRAVAEDRGEPASSRASVPIVITIEDVNDNPPVFSQQVYKSTIAENLRVSPPAAILQLRAEDKDVSDDGKIRYGILEQSEPGAFTVDEATGIIYPAKAVKGNTVYHLTVTASDSDNTHFDTAKVDINVLSVNKQSPVFIQPDTNTHVLEIDETEAKANYLLTTVKAVDGDEGENGRISYFLKVDNQNVLETAEFIINSETGELRSKTFLDREHSPQYQLVLVATDHGTPAKFETLHFLTLVLKDSNDNTPQFSKEIYEFQVLENQPAGIIIGTIKATDKDSGEHGKVYYHILEGSQDGYFTLDRTQGLLRANISFDREKLSDYQLTVYASNSPILEQGAAILNAIDNTTDDVTATVKVKILDENDNAPSFDAEVYYASILYTAKINEPIITVTAKDGDLEENGTLTYMVGASNLYKFGASKSSGSIVPSPFNITQEGVIMTANYMAEYNQDRFVLDIIAQEIAPPHRMAKTQVYVWVAEWASVVRVLATRHCDSVLAERLGRAAGVMLVATGVTREQPCELLLHAVSPASLTPLDASAVVRSLDAQYDELRPLFQRYGVETLVPASDATRVPDSFDPALAALIALLIVLFTGIVTFIVVCACLKHWTVSPPSLQSSKGSSVARRMLDELSTTENPLWLETKLRPYEEQELTMNVFVDTPTTDNTYATIAASRTEPGGAEYATLDTHSALGFQGSTFKPPTPDTPEPPPRPSAGLGQFT